VAPRKGAIFAGEFLMELQMNRPQPLKAPARRH
jgi:hypothetical protein